MRTRQRRTVGFWHSKYEPHLPRPEAVKWDEGIRDKVLNYLKDADYSAHYRGWSTCRVCKCANGSRDQSDGIYVWPEGLAHYVEEHNTGLPQEFIDHILSR